MVTIDTATSNKIANMGLVCSVLVVLIHVKSPRLLSVLLGQGICTIAVPAFFCISGFLFSRGSDSYGVKILKRVRTLLVPFLLWGALAIFWLSLLSVVSNVNAGRAWNMGVVSNFGDLLAGLGLNPFSEPKHGPLWYVRSLLILACAMPLLQRLSRWLGWVLVVIAWGVSLAYGLGLLTRDEFWCCFWERTVPLIGGTYFLVGILLAEGKIPAWWRKVALLMFGCGMGILGMMFYRASSGMSISLAWRVLLVPCLLVGVWYLMPSWRIDRKWTSLSFPLFVVHWFFCAFIWWYLPKWVDVTTWRQYPLNLLIVFGGSLVVISGLTHFFPKASAVLFGDRVAKQKSHPSISGMKSIADQVTAAVHK